MGIEVWILIVLVAAGIAGWAGYYAARRGAPSPEQVEKLEAELDSARDAAKRVQGGVDEHFEQSAQLFGQLAKDYRAFLEHFESSAQNLGLSEARAHELIEKGVQPLLTHEQEARDRQSSGKPEPETSASSDAVLNRPTGQPSPKQQTAGAQAPAGGRKPASDPKPSATRQPDVAPKTAGSAAASAKSPVGSKPAGERATPASSRAARAGAAGNASRKASTGRDSASPAAGSPGAKTGTKTGAKTGPKAGVVSVDMPGDSKPQQAPAAGDAPAGDGPRSGARKRGPAA